MLIVELTRKLLAAVDKWATPTPREKRAGVSSPDPWLVDLFRGGASATASGVPVTEDSALGYAAMWRGVSILSTTTAGLPLKVLEKTDGFPKERRDVAAWRLLRKRANPMMSALAFRTMMTRNLVLWGNGYAEIERDKAGRPMWLWPMLPRYVEVNVTDSGLVRYTYRLPNKTPVTLVSENVLHLKGLSTDGIVGDSLIWRAKESLGNALAADRFGGRYFAQGMNAGAVLEHPAKLSAEAQTRLRENVERVTSGLDNAHRIAIFEEGMKLHRNDMPLDDAQLLDTRHFGIEDVSRWLGVPQHMLSELARATWANVESLQIEFVEYGLMPHLHVWEAEVNIKLFSESTPGTMFIKHIVEGLLRGDTKTRADIYEKALTSGWMNRNEVRLKEDMPPIGPEGDIYTVNGKLVPLDQLGQEPEPEPAPTDEPADEPDEEEENSRRRTAEAHAAVLADAARRMLYADGKAALRRAKEGRDSFLSWLSGWPERRAEAIVAAFGPACDVMGAADGQDSLAIAKHLAGIHLSRSANDLGKVARASTDGTLQDMVTELVSSWPETRAAAFAQEAIGVNYA